MQGETMQGKTSLTRIQQIQDIVNIGENIVKRLLGVKVSREAFDSFEMKFKDQMVGEWEEEAHTDLYHGVEIAEYSKFLDKLQKSTGITDKVRQKFPNACAAKENGNRDEIDTLCTCY